MVRIISLKIFLCYSILDKEIFNIEKLRNFLEERPEIECYDSFSRSDQEKTFKFDYEIKNLLIESDKVLLFCSPHIINNEYIDSIINSAINLNKDLVTIYIKSSHIPKSLRLKTSIEFDMFEIEKTMEHISEIIKTKKVNHHLQDIHTIHPTIDRIDTPRIHANDVTFWVAKANDAFERGKILESEIYFKKASKIEPKNPSLLTALGTIYFEKRKFELSEQYLKQAITINPNYGPAWRIMSMLVLESKINESDTESYFQKAISLDPLNSRAWHNLGLYYHKIRQNFEEAEKCFLKAIELQPGNPLTWHNLGLLYEELKSDNIIAEMHYRKAIELDDKFAPALNNLGILYFLKMDRYQEAKHFLEKAIQIDSTYASAFYFLGIITETKESNFKDAYNYYRQALDIEPTNRDFLRHILNIQKKMNPKTVS